MSAALAFVSDITLLVLGGNLKRKEFLSARLGDVLSHLLLASAVIKYHADQGYVQEELPYVDWSLQYCLQQIQIAFDELLCQFHTPLVRYHFTHNRVSLGAFLCSAQVIV